MEKRTGKALRASGGWMAVAVACALLLGAFLIGGRLIMPALDRAHDRAAIDNSLGATLEPIDAATAHELGDQAEPSAMIVTSIASQGPADRAGIRVGDVVEQIDGNPANETGRISRALKGSAATLVINRHGKRAKVEVPIPPAALQASS